MMKLRVWDRILAALMGVLCILAAVTIVLYAVGCLPVQQIRDAIALLTGGLQAWMRWALFGLAVLLLALLGAYGVGMLFRRRKDKGFVVQHTEYGDMNISIKALENMVKKCVDAHSELTANYTRIYLVRGGVSMDIKITLASGVNIPLTVNALQKQIKQYITSCSGVDVYEVRVKVETDNVKLLPPPQETPIEPAPVEEVRRVEAPAEPPFQHREEPVFVAGTPVQEPEMPPSDDEVQQSEATKNVQEIVEEEQPSTPECASENVQSETIVVEEENA